MLQYVDVSWPQGNYAPGSEAGEFVAATSGDGGSLFVQSTFVQDVANARAAGKAVGFYHFNGAEDAAASAEAFWAAISPYWRPGDLLALDIESYNGGTTPAQSPAWALAFATRLAQLVGLTVAALRLGIYGNRSTMGAPGWGALETAGCWLWLAAPGGYPENTPCGEWSHWTVLQYDIAGNVDQDESESTFAQIAGVLAAPVKKKEVDMVYIASAGRGGGVVGPTGFYGPLSVASEEAQVALATYGAPSTTFSDRQFDVARQTAINIGAQFASAVAAQITTSLDPAKVAAAVVAALPKTTAPDQAALTAAITAAVSAQLATLPAAVIAAEGKKLSA